MSKLTFYWRYGKIESVEELYKILSNSDDFYILPEKNNTFFLNADNIRSKQKVIKYIDTNLPKQNIKIAFFEFQHEHKINIKYKISDTKRWYRKSLYDFVLCFSHGLVIFGRECENSGKNVSNTLIENHCLPLLECFYGVNIISKKWVTPPTKTLYEKIIIDDHPIKYKNIKSLLGEYFSVREDRSNLVLEKTFCRDRMLVKYMMIDWDENLPVQVEWKRIVYANRNAALHYVKSFEKPFIIPDFVIFRPKNKIAFFKFKKVPFERNQKYFDENDEFLIWYRH